ncbi:hypothetical protein NQZ68_000340 [Dissostichus eleginoides]|nr:hypothetical protein NQZ68_000340 [Dissostichus eleginoides]
MGTENKYRVDVCVWTLDPAGLNTFKFYVMIVQDEKGMSRCLLNSYTVNAFELMAVCTLADTGDNPLRDPETPDTARRTSRALSAFDFTPSCDGQLTAPIFGLPPPPRKIGLPREPSKNSSAENVNTERSSYDSNPQQHHTEPPCNNMSAAEPSQVRERPRSEAEADKESIDSGDAVSSTESSSNDTGRPGPNPSETISADESDIGADEPLHGIEVQTGFRREDHTAVTNNEDSGTIPNEEDSDEYENE